MTTRRTVVLAAATVLVTAALGALAQTAAKPILHSAVFNWADLQVETKPTGERRQVFDSPTATLDRFESHVTTLNPGESPHAAHRHPEEEVMLLKEGTLEAVLSGQTNRVDAGGMIFCAAQEWHSLRNIGTNRATYYVFKFVPPGLNTNRLAAAVAPAK
jgi:XRE family transcriptional regulator, regulator of sulfur utilization